MNNSELFLLILSQPQVLQKISTFLSSDDCYNLSKTCKTCFIKIGDVKRTEVVLFSKVYSYNLEVRPGIQMSLSEVIPDSRWPYKYFNPRDIKALKIDIELRTNCQFEEIMVAVGEKINEILNLHPFVKMLHLEYKLVESARPYIQESIRKIKCDTVSTLKFSSSNFNFDFTQHPVPVITDHRIFNGFKNLKKFILPGLVNRRSNFETIFFQTLSKIEGVTIEFPLFLSFFCDFYTRKERHTHFILKYFVEKKIFLSLPYIFGNDLNLIYWLRRLNTSGLSILRRLDVEISSYTTLHDFSSFLKHMENLESLRIDLKIDEVILDYDLKENLLMNKYESFSNLKNLKTIYLICDYFKSYGEKNKGYDRKIDDGDDLEFSEVLDDCDRINRYKRHYQNQIMSFLNGAPRSIENVYISGMSEMTDTTTLLLKEYFPNLSFLLLKNIEEIDDKCLKNFENLKIFVSWVGTILEVPSNVKVCMVIYSYKNYYYRKSDFYACSGYYSGLGQFTKEYFVDGSIEGMIFFSHLQDYESFKSRLGSIAELHTHFSIK